MKKPYNTIAQADSYFATHFGYSFWAPLSADVKNQLLASANQFLDSACIWNGDPASPTQDNAFPRKGMSTIPGEILLVELEIASLVFISGGSAFAGSSSSGELLELKAGSAALKFSKSADSGTTSKYGAKPVNDFVNGILSKYGECALGGGSCSQIPMELG